MIAGDGRAYELLRAEFPRAKLLRLKGYHPVYPDKGSMVVSMAFQVPKFLFAIAREHFELSRIIRDYSIDAVISDNRYGLWSKDKPSVLITHQVFIKMPRHMKWIEAAINRLNHFFIKKFRSCWVPDEAGNDNLSGELSHGKGLPPNVEYIGLLKRLSSADLPMANSENGSLSYDLLVLLSGPEPQRTSLEKKIALQLSELRLKTLIVRGVTEENRTERLNDLTESVSSLTTAKLSEVMKTSEIVVCRAGYSSLMELVHLKKKAVIIPTPGQTEQEFLAERCSEMNYFRMEKQTEMNLSRAINKLKETTAPKIGVSSGYQAALHRLVSAN